jgi:hypothetical protein
MRPVGVVVPDVLMDDDFEMLTTEDEHPVQTFTPAVPTNRSAKALARGALTGVRMIRTPSALRTSSKLAVNLASRSRIRNLTDCVRWDSSKLKFLAC